MCRHHGKVDGWIVQCVLQPYSHPNDVAMCHCSQPFKTWKPCRLVTTKLSSNITLVHYSQTGRISILMRIFNYSALRLSSKHRFPQLTKSWNSIYWLSQPIQKHHPMGVIPDTPSACDIVCQQVLYWSSISRSAILSSDGTCSTEIRLQIPSANAAEAKLNRIWKSYMSISTKFKETY